MAKAKRAGKEVSSAPVSTREVAVSDDAAAIRKMMATTGCGKAEATARIAADQAKAAPPTPSAE